MSGRVRFRDKPGTVCRENHLRQRLCGVWGESHRLLEVDGNFRHRLRPCFDTQHLCRVNPDPFAYLTERFEIWKKATFDPRQGCRTDPDFGSNRTNPATATFLDKQLAEQMDIDVCHMMSYM